MLKERDTNSTCSHHRATEFSAGDEPIRLLIVDDSAADVEFYEYLLRTTSTCSAHADLLRAHTNRAMDGYVEHRFSSKGDANNGYTSNGHIHNRHAAGQDLSGSNMPIEIRSALTGGEGTDLFYEWHPHCILLDYMLPDMNGVEFIEELMQPDGTLPTAIVVSTGQGDEQVAVDVMKSGAHDYVVKNGLSSSELIKILHNALDKFHLEQQIKDRQEELTLFAARASHDLVSPLSNLSLCAQILKYDSEARHDVGALDIIDTVLEHIDHMDNMLKGLSTYARVGRSGVNFERVDLNTQIENVLSLHEGLLLENVVEITADKLPIIWGDPMGISQLLQNLLTNAVKYRNEDPPHIQIRAIRRAKSWIISVQDNGIGIEKEHHKKMFEPFWRLHDRSTYPGSGLGLSTCMKIVRQHWGEMWIDSAPSEGTTIHFTLPAYEPEPA